MLRVLIIKPIKKKAAREEMRSLLITNAAFGRRRCCIHPLGLGGGV